jgi:Nucleotide modification associated domain 1
MMMNERGLRIGNQIINECGNENCLGGQVSPHYHGGTAREEKFADAVWEIMDEIGNLLITKQADYGPGNINNAFGGPINGLMVRIGDKFERLKNLYGHGRAPQHEPIEDSFKDMANYAVIALMIERGKWPK